MQKGCRCRMHTQTDFQNRCQIKQFVTDNLGLIISCYQVNKSCRKIKAQFVVFCSHISITILAKAPIPPGDGLYQLLFEVNNVSVITAHHSPPFPLTGYKGQEIPQRLRLWANQLGFENSISLHERDHLNFYQPHKI